jgi:hypothetical protein
LAAELVPRLLARTACFSHSPSMICHVDGQLPACIAHHDSPAQTAGAPGWRSSAAASCGLVGQWASNSPATCDRRHRSAMTRMTAGGGGGEQMHEHLENSDRTRPCGGRGAVASGVMPATPAPAPRLHVHSPRASLRQQLPGPRGLVGYVSLILEQVSGFCCSLILDQVKQHFCRSLILDQASDFCCSEERLNASAAGASNRAHHPEADGLIVRRRRFVARSRQQLHHPTPSLRDGPAQHVSIYFTK